MGKCFYCGAIQNSALGGFDELDHVDDFGAFEGIFDFINGLAHVHAGAVKQFIGFLDLGAHPRSDAGASHTHHVDPLRHARSSAADHVGGNILIDSGESADHGQRADARELMEARHAGKERPVFDHAVACKRSLVHHDDVITEEAIMRDVAIGHQKILITDHGGGVNLRAAVDGDEFPDNVLGADLGEGLLALVGEVLGFMPDHGVHVDRIVVPDLGPAGEEGPGEDLVMGTDLDPVLNDDVRANNVSHPDLDLFSDNGAGMDLRHSRNYIITLTGD